MTAMKHTKILGMLLPLDNGVWSGLFPSLLCTLFALLFFFSENVLLFNKKNKIQNYSEGGLPTAEAVFLREAGY